MRLVSQNISGLKTLRVSLVVLTGGFAPHVTGIGAQQDSRSASSTIQPQQAKGFLLKPFEHVTDISSENLAKFKQLLFMSHNVEEYCEIITSRARRISDSLQALIVIGRVLEHLNVNSYQLFGLDHSGVRQIRDCIFNWMGELITNKQLARMADAIERSRASEIMSVLDIDATDFKYPQILGAAFSNWDAVSNLKTPLSPIPIIKLKRLLPEKMIDLYTNNGIDKESDMCRLIFGSNRDHVKHLWNYRTSPLLKLYYAAQNIQFVDETLRSFIISFVTAFNDVNRVKNELATSQFGPVFIELWIDTFVAVYANYLRTGNAPDIIAKVAKKTLKSNYSPSGYIAAVQRSPIQPISHLALDYVCIANLAVHEAESTGTYYGVGGINKPSTRSALNKKSIANVTSEAFLQSKDAMYTQYPTKAGGLAYIHTRSLEPESTKNNMGCIQEIA